MSETEKQAREPVSKCCGSPLVHKPNYIDLCGNCGKPFVDASDKSSEQPPDEARECAEQPSVEAIDAADKIKRDALEWTVTGVSEYRDFEAAKIIQEALDSAISKAVASARNAALEEAAKVADRALSDESIGVVGNDNPWTTSEKIAEAIREMKSKKEGER